MKSGNALDMSETEISNQIICRAIEVHKHFWFGLLESVLGNVVEKENPMPLFYYDVQLEYDFNIDILVKQKIVSGIKSVKALNEIHLAQTLTYMKLGDNSL